MAKRAFKRSIVTPTGTCQWPWLTMGNPDTKFGPGVYRTNLIIDGSDAEAFMKKVEEIKQEAENFIKEENPQHKPLVVPIDKAQDENGKQIPGQYIVKAKAKAYFQNQDGTQTHNEILIVDAKKTKLTDVSIWSGTKAKLAIDVGVVATAVYTGLVFRLKAVQVIDLVTGGSGTDSFDVEDGFEADETQTKTVSEVTDEDEAVHF